MQEFRVRKYPRLSVRGSFVYQGDSGRGEGRLWDLSLGGWQGTAEAAPHPTVEVTAILKLKGPQNEMQVPIQGAIIRWVKNHTMGWEITSITEDAQVQLAAFLTYEFERRRRASLEDQSKNSLITLLGRQPASRHIEERA
jgi:hypothetical protein